MTKLYKKLITPAIAFATALTFYSCNNSDIVEAINNVGNKVDSVATVVESSSNKTITHCDSSAKTIVDALGYNTPFTIGGDSILFQDRIYVDSLAKQRLESNDYLRSKIGGVSTESSSARSSYKHKRSHYKSHHRTHYKNNSGSQNSNGGSQNSISNKQSQSLPTLDKDSLNKLVEGVYKDNSQNKASNSALGSGVDWLKVLARDGEYKSNN